jgi:hypothetical protein
MVKSSQLAPIDAPEAIELKGKLRELEELEREMVEGELDLADLRFSLKSLEVEYFQRVGCHFQRLDQLKAEIADLVDRYRLPDAQARTLRQEKSSIAELLDCRPNSETRNSQPSDEAKRLYRQIAMAIHPDLAVDDDDRARRTETMIRLNQAYQDGDESLLAQIWNEWTSDPTRIMELGVGADLVRTIRRIAQVKERIQALKFEKQNLEKSELGVLASEIENGKRERKDILTDLASSIKSQCEAVLVQLESLI